MYERSRPRSSRHGRAATSRASIRLGVRSLQRTGSWPASELRLVGAAVHRFAAVLLAQLSCDGGQEPPPTVGHPGPAQASDDPVIDPDLVHVRVPVRSSQNKNVDSGMSQHDTCQSTHGGQQETLGKQLSRYTQPARTQSHAGSDLSLPCRGSSHQEAGHVGAGNQEKKS